MQWEHLRWGYRRLIYVQHPDTHCTVRSGRNSKMVSSKEFRIRAQHGRLKQVSLLESSSTRNRSLTRTEVIHIFPNLQHDTRTLMSQPILPAHNHIPNPPMFPEMYIRSTYPRRTYVYQTLIRTGLRNIRLDQMQRMVRIGMNGQVARFAVGDCQRVGFAHGSHNCNDV